MKAQTLQAEVREKSGKGPARQLRMRGLIPSIYYGPGTDPIKLAVSPETLTRLLSGGYGRNQVIELALGGEAKLALVKDLEIDPVSRRILHADFYAIAEDRLVETLVPFATVGRAHGVAMGGSIRKLFRDLPVRCYPQNVPAAIEVDVSAMEIGSEIKVEDLDAGEGVEVLFPPQRRVLLLEFREARAEETEEAPAAAAAAAPVK